MRKGDLKCSCRRFNDYRGTSQPWVGTVKKEFGSFIFDKWLTLIELNGEKGFM